MFELLLTKDGLTSPTKWMCRLTYLFIFYLYFLPADQLSGCRVSHGGRDNKRRGRCKRAGVTAAHDGVWHLWHRLLTPPPPQHSHSPAVGTAGLLSQVVLSFRWEAPLLFIFIGCFHVWSNKISQCWCVDINNSWWLPWPRLLYISMLCLSRLRQSSCTNLNNKRRHNNSIVVNSVVFCNCAHAVLNLWRKAIYCKTLIKATTRVIVEVAYDFWTITKQNFVCPQLFA